MYNGLDNTSRYKHIQGSFQQHNQPFFGLIEQVSWAFSKCEDMKHFRHLLSPKTQFLWTEELQKEFDLANQSINQSINQWDFIETK